MTIKSPFPWFGGKSRAAKVIWNQIGDVRNYVEPFAGSLAVLLQRPHSPGIETVNDVDKYLANFWRAIQADPESVAAHADWPVNETCLEARHFWLISEGRLKLDALMADPDGYDAKIAGWWVWGVCAWIGGGWCSSDGPWCATANGFVPHNAGRGINRQLPHIGDAGRGINRQLPHIGDAGRGIRDYLCQISVRLRRVRVACGDWRRVLTPSITFQHGITGIVLDPPYGEGDVEYTGGGNRTDDIAKDVRQWAIENGGNRDLRIALCGYEGHHEMPPDWTVEEWKAGSGYSKKETQGQLNRHRERVWFSPQCIKPELMLFSGVT